MRALKMTAALTAAAMLSGAVPGVQVSAETDFEEVAALVKEASDANPDYTVTVSDTGLLGSRVFMFPGSGGYTRIYRDWYDSNDYYHCSGTMLNPDGEVIVSKDGYTIWLDNGIISCYYSDDWSSYSFVYSEESSDWEWIYNDGDFHRGEYYDLEGNKLFEHPDDIYNDCMENGFALARYVENGKSRARLINEKGETVLELPESFTGFYEVYYKGHIGRYSEGLLSFSTTDALGDTIFDVVCEDALGEIYPGGGYMDLEGNIVIPQQFSIMRPFHDGLALVGVYDGEIQNDTYDYIDKNGNYVTSLQFDYASDFSEGYACVRKDGYCGYIDTTGELVIPMEYGARMGYEWTHSSFRDGCACVSKDGYFGYIDTDNNPIIPFEYDDALGENEGLFTVGMNGDYYYIHNYGMVDANNEVVVPLIFDDISITNNGIAYAILDETVYRLEITFDGDETLEPGDLNGDGEIDTSDASAILIAIAEMGAGNDSGLTEAQSKAADVNGNGEIEVNDVSAILLYIAAKGAGENVTLSDFIS